MPEVYEVHIRENIFHDRTIFVRQNSPLGAAIAASDYLDECNCRFLQLTVSQCLSPEGNGVFVPLAGGIKFRKNAKGEIEEV